MFPATMAAVHDIRKQNDAHIIQTIEKAEPHVPYLCTDMRVLGLRFYCRLARTNNE